MQDGKQNVPFDRILMRIKDITSIACNLLTVFTAIITALWLGLKFIESQNEQQKVLSEIIAHSAKLDR